MRAVSYLRVSTRAQSASGLGIEAQRAAVARHLPAGVEPLAEYVETESGRSCDRAELRRALDHCRRSGAVLVVAKVDRLARSARFLLELLDSGVQVDFADLPQVSGPTGRFMLATMANVAELEAGLISQRTRDALRAARARGVRLGNPRGGEVLDAHRGAACSSSARSRAEAASERAEAWRGELAAMLREGLSNTGIADALNARGEPSVSGRGAWTATAVRRLRQRLGLHGPVSGAA
ncbi:MAG: recombinase family protein [Maricaulaceae bacterium]|jgi:DNA invertase Pin-like site-specific DNA recombinase